MVKVKAKHKAPQADPKEPSGVKDDSDDNNNGSSSQSSMIIFIAMLSFLAGLYTKDISSSGVLDNIVPIALRESSLSNLKNESVTAKLSMNQQIMECNEDNLANYLHDRPVRGLHILCFYNNDNDDGGMKITYYEYAQRSNQNQLTVSKDKMNWTGLSGLLEGAMDLNRPQKVAGSGQQPWALFTSTGSKISDFDDLAQSQMVLAYKGGSWVWPGVREGFERVVDVSTVLPVEKEELFSNDASYDGVHRVGSEEQFLLKTLSLEPLIISVDRFLKNEECTYIQNKAEPSLQGSGVSHNDADKGSPATKWRTSWSTFLSEDDDPMLLDISRRTASLTRVPKNHQEFTQVLRYRYTEKYDAHHDYFNPELYKTDPGTLKLIDNGNQNRLVTVFWYLSDVEEGGETIFPRYRGAPNPTDYTDCTKGLKVKPERGKIIMFYSLLPSGELDPYSLHGACPVKEGIKWAANKWVWNHPKHFSPL